VAFKLDEVDIQLLNALQADADRTNLELARLVGLSPAATLHRVRALKESGVIRIIRADVDPAAMGRHDPRATAAFEDHIRSVPQVISADNVAGETDYLLSVVARDVEELQQVLAGLSARGGTRLVTYLRLAETKPPSPLPLGVTATTDLRARRQGRRGDPDRER
jgi:Lrp/AsnC family leucine-responsive transcriptional regulator